MKKVLLALFAIVLLAGAGGGAFLFFQQPAEAAGGGKENAGKGHGDEKGKGSHGPSYVEMDPLVLPIVSAEGVSQFVNLVITIEVEGEKEAAKVKEMQPRLNDAYIQNMYGILHEHAAMKGGVLQVGMVKEKLKKVSHKILGEKVVQDILLQFVEQRRL